jgi:sigma-B regulation protein RsbU (phosphoserine phosphatase)
MSTEVRNGSKILVVDDEPDLELMVRTKFRKQIKLNEMEFVFAQNGQEALDKLVEDSSIDLVMSDINMPVMDGLTLLSRLGSTNRIVKAVIVSAYGDMQNIRTAMNRGAYDFLMKPIDFEDFQVTVAKTRKALDEIKQGARAKDQLSAIQHELRVATRIQQSILPRTFPPFPERKEFSIFAEMIAAREVGGDFYDFFLIDDNRLGFVVGDVSGKGVPASILMAVSRTLLRATAMTAESAGECLNYVNQVLVRQSDPAMFVTIFYGILHTRTGELEFSIGGHNPPFLFSERAGVEMMKARGGMIVGMIEQARYTTERVQLEPGDGIFLYTDGVTEAEDVIENQFGEERVEALLSELKGQTVEEIIRASFRDVATFTAGAAQSDDITAMALRYEG